MDKIIDFLKTNLKNPRVVFSLLLVVGFFLPWISLGWMKTFSGYNIPEAVKNFTSGVDMANAFLGGGSKAKLPAKYYLSFLLYLIPLAGLANMIIYVSVKKIDTRIFSFITGLIPFAFLIYALIDVGNVLAGAGIGFYLCIFSGLFLILSAFGIDTTLKFEKIAYKKPDARAKKATTSKAKTTKSSESKKTPATSKANSKKTTLSNSELKPHRDQTVLILGILAFFVPLTGLIAWILGANDLKKMKKNIMDPSGRSKTRTGMILGMVVTILQIIGIAIGIAIIVLLGAITVSASKNPEAVMDMYDW
ncbi:MAG: hypothetical protein JXR63_07195 [Spirochaetales bacterium]|nr:hypothetical protein [Spirochaetales bacterium]